MNGFLFINKPAGMTSRDVCNLVSKKLRTKKVGHIGTLDPFATGLLIVTVGKGTKAGAFIEGMDKTYQAKLKLGEKSTTGDCDGIISKMGVLPEISLEHIEKATRELTGEIDQIPPMTSAIHYNGEKLYKLAHKGIEVERKPRKIRIFSLKCLDFSGEELVFEALVSKGTYIRVLGEDLAFKLNTVGYLKELKRTNIGPYKIEECISLDDVCESAIVPIFNVLSKSYKTYVVDKGIEGMIKCGKRLDNFLINETESMVFLVNKENEALAIYEKDENGYSCKRGLWSE